MRYGAGAARFAGATYDPTSHYRAAAVFAFHARKGLTPEALREMSQRQVALLIDRFEALDSIPAVAHVVADRSRDGAPASSRSGRHAPRPWSTALRARGVSTDARGETLRLGPAPYVSDVQIEMAVAALGESARQGA